MVCDSEGNCYCLRMGVIGTFDTAANDKDVSSFVDWLNTKSNAIVTMVKGKPTLNQTFLSDFDILLFIYQADSLDGKYWNYKQEEADSLATWIEKGGGVVTVTGFNGKATANEVNAINSILEPATGISYNADAYLDHNTLATNSYCYENASDISQWDPDHDISREISHTAAFWGYSINAPREAEIVATAVDEDAVTENAAVSLEMGKGRVFAYADEWPLLSNLWLPGTHQQDEPNPYDPCYDTEKEQWINAENYFQHPQFWYNVIKWTAPENDCFTIDEPVIIIE